MKLYITAMATISSFYGIKITMYSEKGEAHNTPHFHAKYGSEEASIAIENLKILAGTINDRAYGLVKEWASLHREELNKDWTLLLEGQPVKKITPLDGKPPRRAYTKDPVEIASLKRVQPLPDFRLDLTFMDGFSGILDLKKTNLFTGKLTDEMYFNKVSCRCNNAHWPGNFDLDPTSLYEWLAFQKGLSNQVRYA